MTNQAVRGTVRRTSQPTHSEAGGLVLTIGAGRGKEWGMPQAIMDPEEVRRFAEELRRFNTEVQDRMVSLQARFNSLGDTWQDQEHSKFAEEFKQATKVLKKFIELSNQHTPYLLRKAQKIEDYLSQR